MKEILILGSTGMLGNAVTKTFLGNKDYELTLSYRRHDILNKVLEGKDRFNVKRTYHFDATYSSLHNLSQKPDYVINCLGTIKPFMDSNPIDSIKINSVFPRELANLCEKWGSKLIHITTDCVYTGKDGLYKEDSPHDATDNYGKTKSLGEAPNAMVIRTSIIGNEIHKDASLVAWVKSQEGKTIKGFTNHLWNGVTTNQYGKFCKKIIEEDMHENGLFHIFSNILNKYELVSAIIERYNLDIKVEPFEAPIAVDRTLSTMKNLCKKLQVPTLAKQIAEML